MTLTSNSFIMADTHITVCFADGFQATVYASDPNYGKMSEAVRNSDWDRARELAEPAEAVRKAVAGVDGGDVHIDNGIVLFGDLELHNTLTDRMLAMLSDGFDVTPLMLFLENLMSNPSFRAVNELYDFLEASHLPITEDGHFLAYKRIKEDYTDCHSGTMDNSIGEVVEMPRNMVDEDKNRTCSAGLHFCARSYLDNFHGARIVVLKINPADVVAIPTDYNNAKGRTCRYEVIQELEVEAPAELEAAIDTQAYTAGVLQLDDEGETVARFDNLDEAAAETGIKRAYIARVLKGDRPKTGGFGFQYEVRTNVIDEDELDDGTYDEEDSDLDFRF